MVNKLKSITVKTLKYLISSKNIIIIDIRPLKLFKSFSIPNSININETELINNPQKYITKTDECYIICSKGISSKAVATILYKKGYNTSSVIGGINAYKYYL